VKRFPFRLAQCGPVRRHRAHPFPFHRFKGDVFIPVCNEKIAIAHLPCAEIVGDPGHEGAPLEQNGGDASAVQLTEQTRAEIDPVTVPDPGVAADPF